ncbi:MAG: iron-sulfur cluster carrier protein ApbC [Gammaproteobacteria bacterium]|nr:MAG: iron-sulfur cluster carrier protein ApbC [Gammaproteobacteria bacterium]
MTELSKADIEERLKGWVEPHLGQDLISAGCVKSIEPGHPARLEIELGFPCDRYRTELILAIQALFSDDDQEVEVEIRWQNIAHQVQTGTRPLPNVKNIIAVASGKGGVGKSTVAVNLALALSQEGARVGMLDADIYGPSQPRMLGIHERPESLDGKTMEPPTNYGIQANSIGFLIDEESPMIWRGPMVTQALIQLLEETNWHDLDFLIIDLPPGTGDIQLTLSQKIPVSGAVIVTTPQDIALLDARKGLKMFEKVNVPVLGVVENMATHICSKCGHQEAIFGEQGGEKMAAQYGVPFLGRLPLDIHIREQVDSGHPSVIADPEGNIARSFREIALRTVAELSLKKKDYSAKFPKITVENT